MSEGIPHPTPVVIGVAGGSGSGKTTASMAILDRVGTEHLAYIEHDAYYHDLADIPSTQGIINFDHPDALETSLLIEHIQQLKAWQSATVPVYDFTTYVRTAQVRVVQPQPIILVEGILVFAEPALRECFDVRIFVDTDADLRFIRRLTRDLSERGRTVDSVVAQYLQTVRPMHLEFVEPSKRYADVIIPEGGKNIVAIEMVASRIRSLLDAAGHASPR
ncbi:uridine kinase [Aggregatilinea lenta]|uniref:uridine kinase n=1 Tax=Aggregatilinea lenta TaxID=913108 RepID=UPI000E5A759B|nr:uridine kinase [Aggregatilinea lenta]